MKEITLDDIKKEIDIKMKKIKDEINYYIYYSKKINALNELEKEIIESLKENNDCFINLEKYMIEDKPFYFLNDDYNFINLFKKTSVLIDKLDDYDEKSENILYDKFNNYHFSNIFFNYQPSNAIIFVMMSFNNGVYNIYYKQKECLLNELNINDNLTISFNICELHKHLETFLNETFKNEEFEIDFSNNNVFIKKIS